MRIPFFAFFLFLSAGAFCQDLSGIWTGIIDQPGSGFKLNLEITSKDGALSGTCQMTDAEGNYVLEKFSGTVVKEAVQINETDVIDSTWPVNKPYFFWCVKQFTGNFIIEQRGDKISITGTWTSNKGYPRQTGVDPKYYTQGFCSSGNFYISKPYKAQPRPADLVSANINNAKKTSSSVPVNAAITKPLGVPGPGQIPAIVQPITSLNPNKPVLQPVQLIGVQIKTVKTPVVTVEKPTPQKIVVTDGYYHKTVINKHAPALAALRETDVLYAKRVWRDLDVREKLNNYLASPKVRLIDVLVDAIEAGTIVAYDPNPAKNDPNGDSFGNPLTPEKAKLRLADSVLIDKFDKEGNKVSSTLRPGEFNPDSVLRFRIKEDWLFDKQRGVFEPRIVGLAPLRKVRIANVETDYQPIFWIYFQDARKVLAKHQVANNRNDAAGLTFDDVFMKRLFTSYIVKVSNRADERIKDYKHGIDQLYESEKFKKALRDWELNLWQY